MTWDEFVCLLRGHRWEAWRRMMTGGPHMRRACRRCGNVETIWDRP